MNYVQVHQVAATFFTLYLFTSGLTLPPTDTNGFLNPISKHISFEANRLSGIFHQIKAGLQIPFTASKQMDRAYDINNPEDKLVQAKPPYNDKPKNELFDLETEQPAKMSEISKISPGVQMYYRDDNTNGETNDLATDSTETTTDNYESTTYEDGVFDRAGFPPAVVASLLG